MMSVKAAMLFLLAQAPTSWANTRDDGEVPTADMTMCAEDVCDDEVKSLEVNLLHKSLKEVRQKIRSHQTKFAQESSADEPIDCVADVGEWGNWSACSKHCGGGKMNRKRTVTVRTNSDDGGKLCPTSTQELECNSAACDAPCELSEWSAWSSCDSTCKRDGPRPVKTRTKAVIKEAGPQGYCPKPDDEDKRIKHQICECRWSFAALQASTRNCNAPGYSIIDRESDCREAADTLKLNYMFAGSWSFAPTGCIIYKKTRVYMNWFPNGPASAVQQPICWKGET